MSFLSRMVAQKKASRRTRVRPALELLEDRCVPSASPMNLVYTLTNDTDPGENAVLAYSRKENGGLKLEGTYPTGGTGLANRDEILGTDDNDLPLIASRDGRFLFAVNGGSDDVSVFRVNPTDGSLTLFSRTPSGGEEPVSVGLTDNNTLVVVNQGGDDLGRNTGASRASYTSLRFTTDGILTPIPGSKIEVDNGAAPTVAYVAPNGFVYSAEMFDDAGANQTNPLLQPGTDTRTGIRVLKVDPTTGVLSQVEFEASPVPNIWLGLKANPAGTTLYAGFAASSQVGVFRINATNGSLDFLSAVGVQENPDGRPTATCWLEVSPDGQRLYAVNNFDNSVSVFSLANPQGPVLLQQLFLKNSGPAPDFSSASPDGVVPDGLQGFVSSDPKEITLSPDGKFLYIVNEENRFDNKFAGNQLHILNVAANGLVSEKLNPVKLPGSSEGHHPQGLVALRVRGANPAKAVGAVFVATNHNNKLAPDGPGNEVAMYARAADGTLSFVNWFATGGQGSGPSVRFAGDGLGSAHSVELSQDGKFLFVTNADSDNISVFRVSPEGLKLVDLEPTGDFPNSVTQHGDAAYVLNASGDGSITGFRFNEKTGDLSPLRNSTRWLDANQDPVRPDVLFNPTQVSFTPDGKQLVVTIKDGPAFPNPLNAVPTGPGRVLVFGVRPDDRPSANYVQTNLGNQGPFGFSFDNNGNLITTLFVGGPSLSGAAGSFRINTNGTLTPISPNVPNTQLDTCWIENNGTYAYAANYGSGTISSYKIGPNGTLTLLQAVAGTTNDLPGGDGKSQGSTPLDIRLSPDGKFLYNVLPGSGAVAAWRINADGTLTKLGEFGGLPDTINGDVAPIEFGPGGSPAGIAVVDFRPKGKPDRGDGPDRDDDDDDDRKGRRGRGRDDD